MPSTWRSTSSTLGQLSIFSRISPPGRTKGSVIALERNNYRNVETPIGDVYGVVAAGRGAELTVDMLRSAGYDQWQAHRLVRAIKQGSSAFLTHQRS